MLALVAIAAIHLPPPVVVGYLPSWRSGIELRRLDALTDVVFFSIQPNADGTLNLKDISVSELERLASEKKEKKWRLWICVGGWERSSGFPAMTASDSARRRFVSDIVGFCQTYSLTGVDLDWEHPKNLEEETNYGRLMTDLRAALDKEGMLLTAAIAGWQKLPKEGAAALHWVNVMSYDHPGAHATFENSLDDLAKIRAMGFKDSQIVLGIPLYGRHRERRNDALPYRDLLARHGMKADVNEVEGYYFNGPEMVARKAELIKKESLAGAMVWEVGHDADPPNSLIAILREKLGP
ncbi:MAG: glycoside hydrolase family 18 protein [Fimbriimonadaceae bacterium]